MLERLLCLCKRVAILRAGTRVRVFRDVPWNHIRTLTSNTTVHLVQELVVSARALECHRSSNQNDDSIRYFPTDLSRFDFVPLL